MRGSAVPFGTGLPFWTPLSPLSCPQAHLQSRRSICIVSHRQGIIIPAAAWLPEHLLPSSASPPDIRLQAFPSHSSCLSLSARCSQNRALTFYPLCSNTFGVRPLLTWFNANFHPECPESSQTPEICEVPISSLANMYCSVLGTGQGVKTSEHFSPLSFL